MKAAFLLLSAWLLSGCVTPGSRAPVGGNVFSGSWRSAAAALTHESLLRSSFSRRLQRGSQ
jgi:hypothetical protein